MPHQNGKYHHPNPTTTTTPTLGTAPSPQINPDAEALPKHPTSGHTLTTTPPTTLQFPITRPQPKSTSTTPKLPTTNYTQALPRHQVHHSHTSNHSLAPHQPATNQCTSTTLKLPTTTATRLTTPWLPTIQPQSTAPLLHYRCRMWPNYTSALPRHQVYYRRSPTTLEFYQGTKCTTATNPTHLNYTSVLPRHQMHHSHT